MDEVIPGLWVGDLPSAKDTASLKANNIFSILSAMRGRVTINETFIRHQILLDDTEETDVLVHFVPAITFIQAELDKGRGVLVHCQAGMSRSVTIVAAYLMYTKNIDTQAALDIIRQARPNIDPNPGFLQQLEIFHQAAFNISRKNKTTRMFYMNRTVEEVMNGDGSPPETDMFAKYPRTPSDSAPATPGGPRRRIRCKMCRQELATREHMLDHGQLGAPTPAGLARRFSPPVDVHGVATAPQLNWCHRLAPPSTIRPRRNTLDDYPRCRPPLRKGAAREGESSEPTGVKRSISDGPPRRPPLRPLISGVADLTMSALSMSALDTDDDPEEDTAQHQDETQDQVEPLPSTYAADGDIAAQLFAHPKLAAFRAPGMMMSPMSISPMSLSPPILMNPKCSGYFVEPMKWMEPLLESGQIAGKITCPNKKCGAKLGNYDWAGMCCGCKEWVTPGFCINRSKVDEWYEGVQLTPVDGPLSL
ncbi:hypothetical protein B0H14DRAFT_3620634 [Mycena olivaceomarginata]|nr:hypothetical protein B0H14DRAFT_3620634 [Mycena olivaceomarginata]